MKAFALLLFCISHTAHAMYEYDYSNCPSLSLYQQEAVEIALEYSVKRLFRKTLLTSADQELLEFMGEARIVIKQGFCLYGYNEQHITHYIHYHLPRFIDRISNYYASQQLQTKFCKQCSTSMITYYADRVSKQLAQEVTNILFYQGERADVSMYIGKPLSERISYLIVQELRKTHRLL